jgi:hypothetical protein
VRDGWEKSLFRVYVWDVLWSLFGERLLYFENFFLTRLNDVYEHTFHCPSSGDSKC